MTVMAEYAQYQRPHRRPVGAASGQPMTKPQQQFVPAQMSQQPISPTHYHSRTASSAIFSPASPHPAGYGNQSMSASMAQHQQQQQQQQQQQFAPHPVRRMTNSTVSSTDSNPRTYPQQQQHQQQQHPNLAPAAHTLPYRAASNRSSNTNLRRSTSSRSQASSLGPSSYVALLRKQKATVWCDKTQHVDPRVTAQQKAAKQRAAHEILAQSGRNSIALSANTTVASSGGMLGGRKKLHQVKGTAGGGGGASANLAAGVGMPIRLSASEVGDEGFDEDDVGHGVAGGTHRRTNSGRSSLTGNGSGNQNRLHAPRTNTRLSHGSGVSGVSGLSANKSGSSAGVSPPAESIQQQQPYFEHRDSMGSNGSEERREKEMGDVGDMLAPSAAETQEAKRSTKDELSRRGSVDERSATMRGAAGAMRLFVANPDSDSD